MRTQQRSLIATPSQKSLSHATQDSQIDTSRGFFMPNQSQRRFTRKNNNNTSIQKSKNRSNATIEQDNTATHHRQQDTPKYSKDKIKPAYMRLGTQLNDSRVSRQYDDIDVNDYKSGSFRMPRNRQSRFSCLEDTLRISEQKYTCRQSNKSIDSVASKCGGKSNNIAVLKTQLELKQKQLIVLQDERRRFRNNLQDMKRRQSLLQQQIAKSESQTKKLKQSFKQNISDLQKKLDQYATYNKKLQQDNSKLKKQLLQGQKQKKILQKQLNVFINRQVPKNIRQLQSCRQISLEQTIEELKIQLNRNKSEVEKEMEVVITKLRIDNMGLKEQIKSLQIKIRLTDKKSVDSQRYLQAYTSVKQQYKNLRAIMKKITQQCDLLRAQNVKLKKQIKKLNTNAAAKKSGHRLNESFVRCNTEMLRNQSEKSLNLSLSACSK